VADITEIMMIQNRVEELLLELIQERMTESWKRATEGTGWPTEEEDPVGYGKSLGWKEAWDDANETLGYIVSNYLEGNDWKVERYKR